MVSAPKMHVDARIKRVGINSHGGLIVPAHVIKPVFIWKDGVTPGEPGSAVLNGHSSAKRKGVFDNLHSLKRGDTATTVAGGWTCSWTVRTNKSHPPKWFTDQRMNKLYSFDGPPRLVFITCWKFLGYSPDGSARYHSRTVTSLQLTSCA